MSTYSDLPLHEAIIAEQNDFEVEYTLVFVIDFVFYIRYIIGICYILNVYYGW